MLRNRPTGYLLLALLCAVGCGTSAPGPAGKATGAAAAVPPATAVGTAGGAMATGDGSGPGPTASRPMRAPGTATARPPAAPRTTATPAPTPPVGVAATGAVRVDVQRVGGVATAAVLVVDQRRERVAWHPGSVVPGPGWPLPDQLVGQERDTVQATFNGGFTNQATRGGTRAAGRQQGVLRAGAASFVIDGTGRADVVQWGRDAAGAGAVVVRQNLDLLIDGGRVAATVGEDDTPVWGFGLYRRHATWRTAAGITGDGSLVVVVMPSATTRQLAAAMSAAGAVRAMELDINPEFSCLLTYTHAAGRTTGHSVLPQQEGSASRHLQPSLRDFFSVRPR